MSKFLWEDKKTGLSLILLPFIFTGCVSQKDEKISPESSNRDTAGTQNHKPLDSFTPAAFFEQNNESLEYVPLSFNLMSPGVASAEELSIFLLTHNDQIHKLQALAMAQLYIQEASREGVNSDLAFIQMCLETGYLKFGGTVTPDQNNFCGLGTVSDDVKGHYFETPMEGIRAHVQHMKAYGSDQPLAGERIDPRFFLVERKSAENLYGLTGKWAIDPQYGEKLSLMMSKLDAMIFQNRTWKSESA